MELQDLSHLRGLRDDDSPPYLPEHNDAPAGPSRRAPRRRPSSRPSICDLAASAYSSPAGSTRLRCLSDDYFHASSWSDRGFDAEPGFTSWNNSDAGCRMHPFHFSWPRMFRSALSEKARDPPACGAIDYNLKKGSSLTYFIRAFLLSFAHCLLIAFFHKPLGLQCAAPPPSPTAGGPAPSSRSSLGLVWAVSIVEGAALFMLAQGYFGMRSTRERMERVRQTGLTLAYSFLKTTNANSAVGYTKEGLQLIVYECLALLAAYPVCLIQQAQGNNCEPDITRYCQQVAKALKRLRDGDTEVTIPQGRSSTYPGSLGLAGGTRELAQVDYFFEVFILQLHKEYERQTMKTQIPSMAAHRIIHNLRNHFENMVDLGNLDDRRTPIVRENIDMLAMAGREIGIFAWNDATPTVFLWLVAVCCWALIIVTPYQKCDWLLNSTNPALDSSRPGIWVILMAAALGFISATLAALLDEMWRMWDPFGRGLNCYAWTLGLAMEIDNMLNEFYEEDTALIIRKHSYVAAAEYEFGPGAEVEETRSSDSGLRPLTV